MKEMGFEVGRQSNINEGATLTSSVEIDRGASSVNLNIAELAKNSPVIKGLSETFNSDPTAFKNIDLFLNDSDLSMDQIQNIDEPDQQKELTKILTTIGKMNPNSIDKNELKGLKSRLNSIF